MSLVVRPGKQFTDSISCPMLIMWEIEGDGGILGMKRERSATDVSLTASSSGRRVDITSCKTQIKSN